MAVAVTMGERFARFTENYLIHSTGRFAGQPFVLEPWQRSFIDELLRVDSSGARIYSSALLGIPRKNGKTALAAALALYLCLADGETKPEVILAAGSRDQAKLVFQQAVSFIHGNKQFEKYFDVAKSGIYCPEVAGAIRPVAADGKLQHGLNIHALIKDELHAWVTDRQEALNEALETASGAREQPLSLAITTSGHDKQTILGKLFDKAMRDPNLISEEDGFLNIVKDEKNGFLFYWFGAPMEADPTDPAVWAKANPASWISEQYLRRQLNRPDMDEISFRKLHLNQWTKAASAWFPAGMWQARKEDVTIPAGARIHVAVDAALTHDTTAVAWSWKDDQGGIHLRCHVWAARDESTAHDYSRVPIGRIDLRDVRTFIRDKLGKEFSVVEIVYDPRFFDTIAQDLADDGFDVAPVEQSSRLMADAYQAFYVGTKEGRAHHDGDQVLASHVEAVAAIKQERGWKVSKLGSHHIDAAVAAAIAYWRAEIAEDASTYVFDFSEEDFQGDFDSWAEVTDEA